MFYSLLRVILNAALDYKLLLAQHHDDEVKGPQHFYTGKKSKCTKALSSRN